VEKWTLRNSETSNVMLNMFRYRNDTPFLSFPRKLRIQSQNSDSTV